MKDFQISRNGFNKEEVIAFIDEKDEEISSLKKQIVDMNRELENYRSRDKALKEKEQNISIALTASVEKAKQIEQSSANVYKLKIEQLEILYSRWEKVLNEIVDKYPALDETDNVKKLLSEFKAAIKSNLNEDFRFNTTKGMDVLSKDPMRALLNKLNSSLSNQLDNSKIIRTDKRPRKPIPKDMQNKQSELSRLTEKSEMIKPVYENKYKEKNNAASVIDKFLTDKKENNGDIQVEPSGFDFKEALNPKEDLDEIMKSFDFFKQNNA